MTVPYDLSKELSRRGHEVTIITSDFEYDARYAKKITDLGMRVVPFRCLADIGLFLYSPSMKKWLAHNLKNYDVIHLNNFRSYQNSVVCHYARQLQIPYVLQAHGSTPRIVEKGNLKSLYDWIWGKSILRDASAFLAVTETEVKQYETAGAEKNKIVMIPNGLDAAKFNQNTKRGLFRRRIGINKTDKLILYLGRLHKGKGIDFLLDSFALMNNKDCILAISGPDDGELVLLKERSRRLGVAGRVRFTDFVENVSEAYVDADVVVNPASNEIFGLVPLEALLSGTQVIVTDECGCGDLIHRMDGGYLVKFKDTAGLSRAMDYSLNHPAEGRKLVENAKKYIINNLTWEIIAANMEEIYENCIRDF